MKKAPNFLEAEIRKSTLYYRKRNFLILQETELSYILGKVYSEPQHIQNSRHIQNTAKQLRWNILPQSSYIFGKWNFLVLVLRNFYFLKRNLILYFREQNFYVFQETETPKKTSYIFSKESFSYISGNDNFEKILHISGNGTFLCFRKLLIFQELSFQDQNFFILFFIKKQHFLNKTLSYNYNYNFFLYSTSLVFSSSDRFL